MRMFHTLFALYQAFQHRAALAHALRQRIAKRYGKKTQKHIA